MTLWPRIADLELAVERVGYDVIQPGPGFGEAHPSRLVRLTGAGAEGLGEDITLFMGGDALDLDLAGGWTLASFCDHLHGLDQWPEGRPASHFEMAARFRNWAFESAALDLALQQAGQPLHAVLGRTTRPFTYVNSLGLGDPPDPGTILRRLERYPNLRFKLDAAATWTPEIIETLVGTGAVAIIDFKGRYGLEVEDLTALVRVYERLLDAFPDALLEDPHDLPEITPLVAPHADRVSYDAPIVTVSDLDDVPLPARTFNVKPTRIGGLRNLFALYAACEERGLAMYGGGMGELGVARGQIQLLAAIFSPDGPNDIAPPGFNALDPPAGMPPSPLDPHPSPAGFRRRADA
jgi:L-alanine-DL-glutamate epimerase-like enolase superfamily enzyme